jgi:hypothetical protein
LLPKEKREEAVWGAGGKMEAQKKVSDISNTVNCFQQKNNADV